MTQGVLYQPTEEQRRTVKAMSGFGVPHEGIAILLGIDAEDPAQALPRRAGPRLGRGDGQGRRRRLFHMATVDKNVAAAIFWMKARAGWREKHEVEVTTRPIEQLTDAQLEMIIAQCHDEIAESEKADGSESRLIEHEAEPEPTRGEHAAAAFLRQFGLEGGIRIRVEAYVTDLLPCNVTGMHQRLDQRVDA